MLEKLGYKVESTKEGKETLQKYKENLEKDQPFDAVILDLTIPGGMGGKETISKLLELDPNVRALVSSGYSNDPILAKYKDYGFKGLIVKPYDTEALSKAISKLLEEN
jgi:CheY-like chemotaxis protein